MGEHSKYSPSGASRWMRCPGSIKQCEGIDSPSSSYAREGSAAHELAEKCLKDQSQAADHIGHVFPKYKEWPVTEEMAEAVQEYLDFVRRTCNGTPLVEQKVTLEAFGRKEVYGTVDAQWGEPFSDLHVFDYKHGMGVAVSPEMNPQAMIYALGAAGKDLDCYENVHIHIVQPRCREGAAIKTWTISAADLFEWHKNELVPAIQATKCAEPPLVVGEKQCLWCDAKKKCPARLAIGKATVAQVNGLPSTKELSNNDIANVLSKAQMVEDFIKDIKTVAEARIMEGVDIPGYKLVEGRSSRKWRDEKEVIDFLKKKKVKLDDFSTLKLKTLKVLDKLFDGPRQTKNRHELDSMLIKPEGKPTLAPVDDKRQALQFGALSDFADLLTD